MTTGSPGSDRKALDDWIRQKDSSGHRDEFLEQFESLSTIEEYDAEDSSARLAAQARADEELLHRLLRIYGYYDAQVIRTVSGAQAG